MNWPVPKYRLVPLVYLGLYAFLPREASLLLMSLWMAVVAVGEFLRRRRPEVGQWMLRRGVPDDFFWMTLGVWIMVIFFSGQRILMVALGFIALGMPAAAYADQRWGKRQLGFFVVCAVWSLFFVKPAVAVLASAMGAWIEAHPWKHPWRPVFVLPCLGALALSVLNMVLGR